MKILIAFLMTLPLSAATLTYTNYDSWAALVPNPTPVSFSTTSEICTDPCTISGGTLSGWLWNKAEGQEDYTVAIILPNPTLAWGATFDNGPAGVGTGMCMVGTCAGSGVYYGGFFGVISDTPLTTILLSTLPTFNGFAFEHFTVTNMIVGTMPEQPKPQVPEPSTAGLLGAALFVGVMVRRWRF